MIPASYLFVFVIGVAVGLAVAATIDVIYENGKEAAYKEMRSGKVK